MPIRCLAQVALDRDSALPADLIVNTWHFEGDGPSDTASDRDRWDTLAPGLVSRIQTFYATIGGLMGSILAGTGQIKLYDFNDPKPRLPRVTAPVTFTPASNSLPAEVALCLSMKGAATSGVNMARRRGRVYLGPWRLAEVSGAGVQGDMRPAESLISQVLAAADTMATGAAGTFRLAVYSPTTDKIPGNSDAAWNDVITLSIDNAWDTQRRRGSAPTARTSVTV